MLKGWSLTRLLQCFLYLTRLDIARTWHPDSLFYFPIPSSRLLLAFQSSLLTFSNHLLLLLLHDQGLLLRINNNGARIASSRARMDWGNTVWQQWLTSSIESSLALGRSGSVNLYFIIWVLSLVHEVVYNGRIVIDHLLVVMDFILFKHLFMKRVLIQGSFNIVEKTIVTIIIPT